ncbi:hypothetical protein HBI56_137790 [Parastagonospora nodorum]|uniref:Fungal N-terminal domain-containing protein n=2 Tax=Phaeosphaeria nodorum (strain SN15 / ATCC MYA-4574 / FGSC 10173) TaxID=321614 RepID=A0A7U2I9A8_PHANO|nr:hypothetical protein HBH56_130020 [Parastagonospora nodorum]QRD05555.1 hypothetical protein JI435_058400 [Parastagonospora nodorum SN15]KAH3931513.1 hypothetical protein HBH54_093480 [Parastagonospora nodorum]KAH3996418.1 hypothetical protein HBI10_158110 [Parastagonospora nodorum]KAH4018923.1 hypothetical protein HBI13_127960 [Parastagonospora nodorum]
MDPFSTAASGVAFASLLVRLLQSVGTVKTLVRDFKGASKELERLDELLERLCALLQDVDIIIGHQKSLPHFPLPSDTLFACLKSCETSLEKLEDITTRYNKRWNEEASALERVKGDFRLALRTQDIAMIEARIQRDVNNLHAALGINTTNILTTVLPILLAKKDSLKASSALQENNRRSKSLDQRSGARSQDLPVSLPQTCLTKTRQEWIQTPLSLFGIRRRRSIRYMSTTCSQSQTWDENVSHIKIERTELLMSWNCLGRRFQLSQRYPYGNIVPSLRVYSLVQDISQYEKLFKTGRMHDIQQTFQDGSLHPFTVDSRESTLLHLAAQLNRSDLCRLLLGYGLKPQLTSGGQSPLVTCVSNMADTYETASIVDTLRLLLFDSDQIDDVRQNITPYQPIKYNLDAIEWLWRSAAAAFHGAEYMQFRVRIVQNAMRSFRVDDDAWNGEIAARLVRLMDGEMLEQYERGRYALLPAVFYDGRNSVESAVLGRAFIETLEELGLDADACIQTELRRMDGGVLEFPDHACLQRVVIFEQPWGGVRWEWVLNSRAPGYCVSTAFVTLATDSAFEQSWPFTEIGVLDEDGKNNEKRMYRWTRRAKARARKERGRTGQQRCRSRMPGAWVY